MILAIEGWEAIARSLGWSEKDIASVAEMLRGTRHVTGVVVVAAVEDRRILIRWTERCELFIPPRDVVRCYAWKRNDPPESRIADPSVAVETRRPWCSTHGWGCRHDGDGLDRTACGIHGLVSLEIDDCTCGRVKTTGVHMRGCPLCIERVRTAEPKLPDVEAESSAPAMRFVAPPPKGGRKRVLPGQTTLLK